ncbi:hypothetical protein DSECCO2_661190 [anaerobic digester metagenome]
MIAIDPFHALDIGNGARNLQNAVKDPGRIAHLVDGILEEGMAGIVQPAILSEHFTIHLAVIEDSRLFKAPVLDLAGFIYPGADGGGGIARG